MLAFLAHAGHGGTDPQSVLHWLTEPVHVAAIAGGAVLALIVGLWLRRRWRRGLDPQRQRADRAGRRPSSG